MKTRSTVLLCSILFVSAACLAMPRKRQAASADIEPRATSIIKAMCDHLVGMKNFSLEAEDTADHVMEDGERIQYAHRARATLKRPSHLWSEKRGDLDNRTFWKNGTSLSFASHDHEVYGQIECPETIDDTVGFLETKYDMSLPLADLLSEDPFKLFTEAVKSGWYVGLHDVEGHPCHHLAFRQTEVDWQIWIDAGDQPVPRKLVINHRNIEGQPQYAALLRNFRSSPSVDMSLFEFDNPDGYEQIDVLELEAVRSER